MFKGAYQRKLLTVLYSGGSNPLEIWDIQVKNGWTRRVKDDDMSTIVFEICGTNVATAYICSPPDPRATLGITLPFITMLVKNLKRYFTFEIQILDDKQMRRRFRFSNYQSATKVRPFTCSVPLALKPGWNQMQLNLANFTMRAYGTNYLETQRVQIHANCRVRRVYFSDRLYAEEELPRDYRIFVNVRQAPQPPSEPPQPQPPQRPSLTKEISLDKVATFTKGPASILKTSSTMKAAVVEEEMTRTSFKSTPSMAERSSLKEFTETVTQMVESNSALSGEAPYERTVTFDSATRPSGSLKKFDSKASVTSPIRGSAIEEENLAERGSLKMQEDGDETKAQETVPQGEVLESVEETIVEEGAPENDENLGPEVSEITEESESPVEMESEFAESEPIPDSDFEEPPSSPEPIDST